MAATMLKKKFGTLGRSSKRQKSDLWIRIKGQKAKDPYHCVWPPFCGTRPDIDWVSLTTHEVTFSHVRVYELSETDSLSVFVSFLEQLSSVPSTRAIVVINTEESYDLDARFSTENYRETPIPVVVVKRKAGEKLLKQIKKNGRDLEASIQGGKEEEEEGKTGTLDRKREKKSKKVREDKGSPLTQQSAVTLPRAKDPYPDTNGVVGVAVGMAGCVAEGDRPQSLEIGIRGSMFAGPETQRPNAVTSTTAAEPEKDSPAIVKNGLKVRIKSEPDLTTREFDYAPAPFCSSLRSVTWAGLTTTETTYPHIRLHNIPSSLSSSQLEDDLSFFFSTVASVTANLALVLINSENSFNLAGKLQSLSEDQIPPFSMVMVTKETGVELMRLLAEHSRDVEAMIQLPPGYKGTISMPSSPPGSPAYHSLSTTVVKNGLKLRLTTAPSEEIAFDYISAPFSLSLRSVDWVRLCSWEATSPHVRLHQLREEDSLSFFMSMLASIPATLAVVLVNYQDGYELSERLSGSSEQGCPVPMVVVTRETGREMERLLRENERAVELKMDIATGSKSNPSPANSHNLSVGVYPAGSHKKDASISNTVIKGGLEIQNGNKTLWFDYGWCSFNQTSVRPFQRQPLTLHEATYPHYRLHRLTHKDSLKFFMSIMESIPATLAVVLVNFDDTFRLSEKFVSGEGESPPVPVILVTNETGSRLARLLEENPRDVKAVVHTQSRETASPSLISDPQPSLTTSPDYEDARGLHVKIGVMGAVVDYEYVPGPYRQEVGGIDWVCLTSAEATYPHIRIHDLKMEDSLSYFMSTMASTPAALAVIFVNSEEHFRLADKFKSEDQSPPVPVLVVTRETGRQLLRLVEQNPREVYMKVDRLSLQDVVERGGLQVRVSNKNSPQKPRKTSFDFVWAPFHQIPRTVAWQRLALHGTTFSHLRLHNLSDSDDLGDFMTLMSSIPSTLALVLVNTASHYRLSERLTSSVQTPPVPVVVVTRETGRELARLLEEHPRELEARVETALKGPLSPNVSSHASPSRSLLFSTPSSASGVVSRGLEVKLTRTEEKRFFSFAWAPFCDSPLSLDWLGLADHQVNYDHIQIQQLQSDKSLSFVLSTFGSLTSTRALLLVNNTYNGYELDEQFSPQSEGPCLPVMVVTKETGAELLGLLKEHGRDVEVKVHQAGSLEEGEGEPDDWEVITSLPPQAEDVPSFPSLMESMATHNIITDGLLVKSKKNKNSKTTKFNYIWAPFCSTRREIDWTSLSLSSSLPKASVFSSMPKTSGPSCVCLHDLSRDKNIPRYKILLQSPPIEALILVNTCNGYKLPQEFTVQEIQKPVLVVTKSTGEALSSLVREGLEARVVFGGTDEEGGGGWVVEGGVRNTLPLEVPQIPEWEDCTPRSSEMAEVTGSVAAGECEALASSAVVEEGERVAVSEVREGTGSQQPEVSEEGGGEEEEKEEREENEKQQIEAHTASATSSQQQQQQSDAQPVFDPELEQSLGEFTILDQTEAHPPADPPATSTPSQPSLQLHGQQSLQPSLTGQPSSSTPSQQNLQPSLTGQPSSSTPSQQSLQPSLPLTPMDTLQDVHSLTPTGASSSLGPGEDSSLCGTPTMLPQQEIVPYTAGPYTGPGSELGDNFLSEVSISGAAMIPGDDIPALRTTSSRNIDWKKPINNGLQIRPVKFQGQDTVSQYFTYQWSRTTDTPQRMDWLVLTEQEDYPDQHIRLHKLEKDSDLQLLMATLDASPAAALLLINKKNSYDIDRSYFPPGEQVWPVPIMVATAETGDKIRSLLSSVAGSGAEARVNIEPSPKAPRKGFFQRLF